MMCSVDCSRLAARVSNVLSLTIDNILYSVMIRRPPILFLYARKKKIIAAGAAALFVIVTPGKFNFCCYHTHTHGARQR